MNVALIFAGGTGQRMKSNIPKQFLQVHGKEIIIHTLELFEINENIDKIYVACLEEWIPVLENLIKKYSINKVEKVIPGGNTGQDTIFKGLSEMIKDHISGNANILIHDGVRPLVSQETINKCIDTIKKYNNAITVTPAYETPIISRDGISVERMLERNIIYTAQAPQCFKLSEIYNAHLDERKNNALYNNIVDSCGLMVKHGCKCKMVVGNRGNIKVTTPEDYCTLLGNYSAEDYSQLLTLIDK